MAIPESFLDELVARSEISEVVASYVHLTRKGKRLLAEEREQWERYARAINTVLELS